MLCHLPNYDRHHDDQLFPRLVLCSQYCPEEMELVAGLVPPACPVVPIALPVRKDDLREALVMAGYGDRRRHHALDGEAELKRLLNAIERKRQAASPVSFVEFIEPEVK